MIDAPRQGVGSLRPVATQRVGLNPTLLTN